MYDIAGLTVEMQPRYELLTRRAALFQTDDADACPDVSLILSDEYLARKHQDNPLNSIEQTEYMWTGAVFAGRLWRFDALSIHASAVAVNGRAYLFSADSGVGKSTHTQLWLDRFGERAFIINDDKPVIRLEQDSFWVYGTPFSGRYEENRNVRVPLGGIIFLERDDHNWIRRLDTATAVKQLIRQSGISRHPERAAAKLALLDRLVSDTLIGQMGCTVSKHAMEIAYQFIEENRP